MTIPAMESTSESLLAAGKGILAADESYPTIKKRFAAIDLASTEESRRNYRDMLFTTPGLNEFISGVILFEETAWRKVIEVNMFGAFYRAREALKRMVPQKTGVVLSTSSVHEEIAWSGYSAYTASKAAVSMLTKTLAQEAGPHGVRVLAVAPGAIRTPINRSVWSDPQSLQDLLEKIPLHRIGEPEEIARLVVVLVSDVSSYVTGRTVFVDGGMTDYPAFAHGG